MSDNKLLTENTIRRFMKLANVDTLTDNFIAETKREELEEEVEETTEEINEEEETELEEQMDDEDEEPEAEGPELEMDMDMDVGDEPAGAADMSLTEEEAKILIDLGKRLEEAMEGAEGEMDEEGEEDEEDPAMAYGDPAMAHSEPGMAYGSPRSGMKENHDDLVQEVLRRVTKRLVAEKLKN